MNKNIHQMVTFDIVSMEIVIQGETEFGHRTIGGKSLEPGLGYIFLGEAVHADVRIFLNIPYVIKDKGAI